MDREAIARIIGSFVVYDDHGGPDTEVLADRIAATHDAAYDALMGLADQILALTPPPGAGGVEIEDVLQRLYRLAYIDGHSDAQYPDGDCDGPVIPVDGVCISDGWRNCRAEFLNLFKEARHDG